MQSISCLALVPSSGAMNVIERDIETVPHLRGFAA